MSEHDRIQNGSNAAESASANTDATDADRDADGPYRDSLEHLLDRLRVIDARLRRRLEVWWAETDGMADEFRGLYVSDAAAEHAVEERAGQRLDRPSEERANTERLDRDIAQREAATLAVGRELRLLRVADLFGLDVAATDALLVALAPEVDVGYETIYSYLQDDVTKRRPTVDLVVDLLCGWDAGDHARLAMQRAFARTAPLVREGVVSLTEAPDGRSRLSRPVTVDERIVDYLLGGDDIDRTLAGVATLEPLDDHDGDGADPLRWVDDEARATVERIRSSDAAATVYVHGPAGAGKRRVAEAVSLAHGRPLLALDAARVPAADRETAFDAGVDFEGVLDRVRREALLSDASVYVANLDARSEAERTATVERLDALSGTVVLAGAEPWRPRRPPEEHAFVPLELAVPPYETRRTIWRDRLGDRATTLDVDGLAAKFRFTPGRIDDAVATARDAASGNASARGSSNEEGTGATSTATRGVTDEALYRACRQLSGRRLERLTNPVESRYRWGDIVLPSETTAMLREIADRITHRGRVYAEWGFAEKYTLGNGLVVLFTGPSGTGKTMAAEIVAGEAGLDLYRIDLASVVSKYIGETEKNLGEIFDEAETTDAVLLFDEADALFGKRTDVRDSHDRYANIEVDYLLQRIEEYDGTVILTTNLKANIDDAFKRRIHVSIDFPRPDGRARRAIWEAVFPDATPVGDLDYGFLSTFELTGGNIRNVALAAAFMAASDGADGDGSVEMKHVVRAMRREFHKTGTLVSPDAFGEYNGLL